MHRYWIPLGFFLIKPVSLPGLHTECSQLLSLYLVDSHLVQIIDHIILHKWDDSSVPVTDVWQDTVQEPWVWLWPLAVMSQESCSSLQYALAVSVSQFYHSGGSNLQYLTFTCAHTWQYVKRNIYSRYQGTLTMKIFNCVAKTVLFKLTELLEQNEGQFIG